MNFPSTLYALIRHEDETTNPAHGYRLVRRWWFDIGERSKYSGEPVDGNAYIPSLVGVTDPAIAANAIWDSLLADQQRMFYALLGWKRECSIEELIACLSTVNHTQKGTRWVVQARDGMDNLIFWSIKQTPGNRTLLALAKAATPEEAAAVIYPVLSPQERVRIAGWFGC
jgi:hypothetical protein